MTHRECFHKVEPGKFERNRQSSHGAGRVDSPGFWWGRLGRKDWRAGFPRGKLTQLWRHLPGPDPRELFSGSTMHAAAQEAEWGAGCGCPQLGPEG